MLFGTWIGVSVQNVPIGLWVEIHHLLNRTFGKVIPALFGVMIVSNAIALRATTGVPYRTALIALALSVAIFASTLLLNVPVNRRVNTWTSTNPPADAPGLRRRWEFAHLFRVAIIVGSFVVQATASS